jgi:hypothetical protein
MPRGVTGVGSTHRHGREWRDPADGWPRPPLPPDRRIRPTRGSGLSGLTDRVEALGGATKGSHNGTSVPGLSVHPVPGPGGALRLPWLTLAELPRAHFCALTHRPTPQ